MVFGLFKPANPGTERREISVGGAVYDIRIQRRRDARRLTMRVRDRTIRLSAPPGTSQAQIEAFVAEHGDWIDEQMRCHEEAVAAIPGIEGPAVFYRGEALPVRLERDARHRGRGRVEVDGDGITIRLHATGRVRPAGVLESWLKREARTAIEAELERVLAVLGEAPCPVGIRDQKTRWGSCSANRRLSFNWRLVMAPPPCLAYVVAHEAAHLVHLDHSREFWGLVAELMPDYRRHQRWLREHQTALFADIGERLAGLGAAAANGGAASAPAGEAGASDGASDGARDAARDANGAAPRPLPRQPDLFQ